MRRLQAFKSQLRPNGQQERDMWRFAGACRFVFNRAMELQNKNHESAGKFISYNPLKAAIAVVRL
ncbi:helix-turn-helix domain-containing protein [Salmonella enterica]|nr:helix-turn-helix domain-containing protein [Salmonella enterica]EHC5972876.1 helix-turn-helix domain-containing protein [Salmonella enterica]EIU9581691.1 helix-turn-helix domain-containing protein [Salmonella enterica]ELC1719918.1 helix-turn-helix domain-containing protein [Salmonella enterica]